jgi:transcriptional regulator with XRE-family HTH domain
MTAMNFREAIGEVIREQRLANGLQLRDVSERGHLSYSHLSEVERGIKEASSMVLQNIANGLGVQTYDLIIEAGYRMAESCVAVPDSPESLFVRNHDWQGQYADLSVQVS